jgi:hypothetical protein
MIGSTVWVAAKNGTLGREEPHTPARQTPVREVFFKEVFLKVFFKGPGKKEPPTPAPQTPVLVPVPVSKVFLKVFLRQA